MPHRDPVLSLAVDNISKIDTVDCERLSSLWTVFTKCAENLENGRRLENLSWRLWYRECQLLDRERPVTSDSTKSVAISTSHARRKDVNSDLPALSNSVESAQSDEIEPSDGERASTTSQKHLTPNKFHELVTKFGKEQTEYKQWNELCKHSSQDEILSGKDPSSSLCRPASQLSMSSSDSICESPAPLDLPKHSTNAWQRSKEVLDPSSCSGLRRASSVVHGFCPMKTFVPENSPEITDCPEAETERPTTTTTSMFFIESSQSESDNESRVATSLKHRKKQSIRPQRAAAHSPTTSAPAAAPKRHTSYREIVDQGSGYESSPFDSDDDESDVCTRHTVHSESAIMSDDDEDDEDCEEEDDDDWDSVCSESRVNSLQDGNMFNKMGTVDSRPGLVSRKSILSTLLTNPMTRLSNAQSKSSPAISQSRRASPTETPAVSRKVIAETDAEDLINSPNARVPPAAIKGSLSPRTTRRNMLATELSESLRRHLLWERRQKSSNNLNSPTVLQRRHTAIDLTKMAAYHKASTSLDALPKDVIADNEFGYNGAGW